MKESYGVSLPGQHLDDLVGKLIVIEGTDGVGRSTQIKLLKEWLEQQGHAVLDTGLTRSGLVGKSIKRAKEGHTLGRITLTLFYTTDFADRLENQIVPALRAGFVVLTDRYIYSLMARAMVRGLDPAWVRSIHQFALKPDAVFYLRVGVEELIPRAVFSRGFDYWESGMDLYSTEDMYDSFRRYQTALLEQFDQLANEYGFHVVDASPEPEVIFDQLCQGILKILGAPEAGKVAGAGLGPAVEVMPANAPAPVFERADGDGAVATASGSVVVLPESDERIEERRRKA